MKTILTIIMMIVIFIEELSDALAAWKTLRDYRAGRTDPWENVKAELGLAGGDGWIVCGRHGNSQYNPRTEQMESYPQVKCDSQSLWNESSPYDKQSVY